MLARVSGIGNWQKATWMPEKSMRGRGEGYRNEYSMDGRWYPKFCDTNQLHWCVIALDRNAVCNRLTRLWASFCYKIIVFKDQQHELQVQTRYPNTLWNNSPLEHFLYNRVKCLWPNIYVLLHEAWPMYWLRPHEYVTILEWEASGVATLSEATNEKERRLQTSTQNAMVNFGSRR